MKTLAILQNQWFPESSVEKVREQFRHAPHRRRSLVKRYLFQGCKTGKRIREAFGDLCDEIEFENASPEIGTKSSSCPPSDPAHVARAIDSVKPDVILVFGKVALATVSDAADLVRGRHSFTLITGPHPAARTVHVPKQLDAMATEMRTIKNRPTP